MGVDRRMWKMSPERLQEHLQLKNRARQIPDKKKQQNKRACRDNSRRASRNSGVFPRGRCCLHAARWGSFSQPSELGQIPK